MLIFAKMWKELVKIALLGTERSQLSTETMAQLQKYGIDTKNAMTSIILESAAITGQMRKAGFILQNYKDKIPEAISINEQIFFSINSARHLKEILDGAFRKLLPEFLFLASKTRKIIPPEYLPRLFETCARNKQLWKTIEPIIGVHGHWLLQQNPTWRRFEKWSADTSILPLLEADIYPSVKDKYRVSEDAVLNVRPSEFNELRSLLQQNSSPVYENYIRQLLQILFFREEMIKEFK